MSKWTLWRRTASLSYEPHVEDDREALLKVVESVAKGWRTRTDAYQGDRYYIAVPNDCIPDKLRGQRLSKDMLKACAKDDFHEWDLGHQLTDAELFEIKEKARKKKQFQEKWQEVRERASGFDWLFDDERVQGNWAYEKGTLGWLLSGAWDDYTPVGHQDNLVYLGKRKKQGSFDLSDTFSFETGEAQQPVHGLEYPHVSMFCHPFGALQRYARKTGGSLDGWAQQGYILGAEYIVIDLDHEDLKVAQIYAREISALLEELDAEHQVFFSGSKGFHIYIHQATVGEISPSPDLADRVSWFVHQLVREVRQRYQLPAVTFDDLYSPTSTIRMPGAKHEKTGLYKVAIPHSMLRGDIARIKRFADAPKPFSWPIGRLSVGLYWLWRTWEHVDGPWTQHKTTLNSPITGIANWQEIRGAIEGMRGAKDAGTKTQFQCPEHTDSSASAVAFWEGGLKNWVFCSACHYKYRVEDAVERWHGIKPRYIRGRKSDVDERRIELEAQAFQNVDNALKHGRSAFCESSTGLGKTFLHTEASKHLNARPIIMNDSHAQLRDMQVSAGGWGEHLDKPKEIEPRCGLLKSDDGKHSRAEKMDARSSMGLSRWSVCKTCPVKEHATKNHSDYPSMTVEGKSYDGPCRFRAFHRRVWEGDDAVYLPKAYLALDAMKEFASPRDFILSDEDAIKWMKKTETFACPDIEELFTSTQPIGGFGSATLRDIGEHLDREEVPPETVVPTYEYEYARLELDPTIRQEIDKAYEKAKKEAENADFFGLLPNDVCREDIKEDVLSAKAEEGITVASRTGNSEITRLINLLRGGRVVSVKKHSEESFEKDGETQYIPSRYVLTLEAPDLPVPVIQLDATPHQKDREWYQQHIPKITLHEPVRAYNPESKLIHDYSKVWGRDSVDQWCREYQCGETSNPVGQLITFLKALESDGKDFGIITHKKSPLVNLIEQETRSFTPLTKDGDPFDYAWFGNLRGLNTMKNKDWVIIVGSQGKPLHGYHEDLCRFSYDGDISQHLSYRPGYKPEHKAYTLHYSTVWPCSEEGEHLFWRSEVAELMQAIGRARLLDGKKRVLLLSHVGVPNAECQTVIDPYFLRRKYNEAVRDEKANAPVVYRDPVDDEGNVYLTGHQVEVIKELSQLGRYSNKDIAELANCSLDSVTKHQIMTPKERKDQRRLELLKAALDEDPGASTRDLAKRLPFGRRKVSELRRRLGTSAKNPSGD